MVSLDYYIDEKLAHGLAYFTRQEAIDELNLSATAFTATVSRLAKKHRLVAPRRGFYLILRPEDRVVGAPDPVRWIDPLMNHLGLDYRITLLRAAAFHGASHQAAMVFQVVVPKQLRSFDIGRHRLQFISQAHEIFTETNVPEWLSQIKSEAGFAKVAGVELTLLDCTRYLHKSTGINGVAQIAHDLGASADPCKLANAAEAYENSSVRRLGFLLEHAGHARQAKALEKYAKKAKSMKPLDPSLKPLIDLHTEKYPKDTKWMLLINESVEIDF